MRNTTGNARMRLGFAKEKWKNMSALERAPFMELSSLERQRFSANQSRFGVHQIQTFLKKKDKAWKECY